MNKSYEHTQIGYLTITAIGVVLIYLIYLMIASEFNWVTLIVTLILGIALFLFATLKVTIDDDWLEIRLGIGMIRRKIPLQDIQSVHVIQYPWYCGWGLRVSLRGEMIYSVSGLGAIKINTNNGVKVIIGTDTPEELSSALRKAIERIR